MSKFQFNGNWETPIKLEAFRGYVNSPESYGTLLPTDTEPIITIIFENLFSEEPDPLPEQLAALDYLIENQNKIRDSLLEKLAEDLPQMIKDWFPEVTQETYYFFPNLEVDKSMKNYIWINTIYIFSCHKDGLAYFGFCGNCKWDEEHGLGSQIHKSRIISWGEQDNGFSSWESRTEANQMAEYEMNSKLEREKEPIKYDASKTKYGKLNPYQQECNDSFILRLIDRDRIPQLIDLIEKGEINVNESCSQNTILEWACNRGKIELRNYLVENGATITYRTIAYGFHFDYIKKIAALGFDVVNITNGDSYGEKTLLDVCYYNLHDLEKRNSSSEEEQKNNYRQIIDFLESKGATSSYKKVIETIEFNSLIMNMKWEW
jgi:hypothetical protein